MARLRACLAEPPAESPLHDEQLRAVHGAARTVGELAGQAELAGGAGAGDLLVLAPLQPLLGALDDKLEQGCGGLGLGGQPVVEGVAQGGLHQPLGVRRRQPLLGLALEFGVPDEHADQRAGLGGHVLGGQDGGALFSREICVLFQAPRQHGAQAGLVGAALRRRHGVAIGLGETVRLAEPGPAPRHRPFDRAAVLGALDAAGEGLRRHRLDLADPLLEEVGQAVREMEGRLGGGGVVETLGGALPPDLHATEQVGLGAGHAIQTRGLERGRLAEDVRVRREADQRALLAGRPELLDGALRVAAGKGLAPLEPVAPHRHVQPVRQGVDHAHAHAVQAAGGLVRLAGELAAGVQHGQDHLQRRLAGVFGVGIDGDAAPVVAHTEGAVGVQAHLDDLGVAGDGLVHGVVEHLGEQVVQGALVGAADVHARAPAHGLQPLQHLDVLGGVGGDGGR